MYQTFKHFMKSDDFEWIEICQWYRFMICITINIYFIYYTTVHFKSILVRRDRLCRKMALQLILPKLKLIIKSLVLNVLQPDNTIFFFFLIVPSNSLALEISQHYQLILDIILKNITKIENRVIIVTQKFILRQFHHIFCSNTYFREYRFSIHSLYIL